MVDIELNTSRGTPLVFISYRRRDCAFIASVICERLERRFGADSVFLDVDDIPLGVDFRQFIADMLVGCRLMLLLVGERWLSDEKGLNRFQDPEDFVLWEIETARSATVPIVPVLAGVTELPKPEMLPDSIHFLRNLQYAAIQGGRRFFADLDALADGVARFLGPKEAAPGARFGIGLPARAAALQSIQSRLGKIPPWRRFQRDMSVQTAAGGAPILEVKSWPASSLPFDPSREIELLRQFLSLGEGSLLPLEKLVESRSA